MANLRKWSTTATGNASVAGGSNTINFAEGQTPGSVNNSMREAMAQLRGVYTPAEWGWVEFSATASIASQTTFKIAGDNTTEWTAGRRWRLKSGSSTRYGSIVSSSYTVETTVTVAVDSGSLSASHSLAALSPIDGAGRQIPTSVAKLAATNSFSVTQAFAAGFVVSGGNALVTGAGGLGYGTGSGGTVTQLTSKSTNVTLDKPFGQITMHNAALAGGATVNFGLNSSSITAADTVIVNVKDAISASTNYIVFVGSVGAGSAQICVRNNTAGSLSDAIVLNYAVIKGATS